MPVRFSLHDIPEQALAGIYFQFPAQETPWPFDTQQIRPTIATALAYPSLV
jgi:hypothetical protein